MFATCLLYKPCLLKHLLHRTTAKRLFSNTDIGLLIIDEANSLLAEEFMAASSRCKATIAIYDPGQNMRAVDWRPEASETDKINAADMLAVSRAARPGRPR